MKKRSLSLILVISILVVVLVFASGCQVKDIDSVKLDKVDMSAKALEYMQAFATTYKDRTSGTGADLKVVSYLSSVMLDLGYEPVGKYEYEEDGTKKVVDGANRYAYNNGIQDSQAAGYGYNAIFEKKSNLEDSKGVIILSTQYDNLYAFPNRPTQADGSYESGASTAAVLTIAELIKDRELPYDVRIIFYGGGSYNWEGASAYLGSLSMIDLNNILLSIDIAQIVGGEFNYAYTLDKKSDYGNLVNNLISKNELAFEKVPGDKRIANGKLVREGLYNYFHIGMLNNNIFMMNSAIPTLNIMSHNWKDKAYPNRTEIKGLENIYQTPADTYEIMQNRVGDDKIKEGLNSTINLVSMLLSNENQEALVTALSTARDQMPSHMAQSDMTGMILGICFKLILILAVIFVMIKMKKIVQDKHDHYTSMLYKQKETVENKPIDVFGWDSKSDNETAGNGDNKEGNDDEKSSSDDEDDIFSDL